jgi:hypothetical protein
MAGFEPITKPEQLPPEGTTIETLGRDFKKLAPSLNPPEMAKDVAAFANRIGGVIIVGAIEDQARAVADVTAYLLHLLDWERLRLPTSDFKDRLVAIAHTLDPELLCGPEPIWMKTLAPGRYVRSSGRS